MNFDLNSYISNKIIIIAEVAQAHEGSLGMAHSYIDAIAEAGATAVKFQTHFADEESSLEEPWRIKFSTQDKTRFDYWKRMEFSPEQWCELAKHAHDRGLLFISSPFSIYAVEVLKNASVDIWKVASGEIINILLLKEISKTNKPIILSTGMSPYNEIESAINLFRSWKSEIMVFQCTSEYPVIPEKVGLNVMVELSRRYNVPVGFSDHSGNIYSCLAAISLGACALEVHVTFDKNMFGPDVNSSVTFNELKSIVDGSHWIKSILSNPVNKDELSEEFQVMRKTFMKSFVSRRLIKKGQKILLDDLYMKKPCIGIPVSQPESVVGKVAKIDIPAGTFILKKMISV